MNIKQMRIIENPSTKEVLDRLTLKDQIGYHTKLREEHLGVVVIRLTEFTTIDKILFYEIHVYGFIGKEFIDRTKYDASTCQLLTTIMIEGCSQATAIEKFEQEVQNWKDFPQQSLIAAYIKFGKIDRTTFFSKYFWGQMS